MKMTDKERKAIEIIKRDGEIKIQLGAAAIIVVNCPLTGRKIENKSNLARGFVVGRKKDVAGYKPYAYVVRIGRATYNASRQAFRVLEG